MKHLRTRKLCLRFIKRITPSFIFPMHRSSIQSLWFCQVICGWLVSYIWVRESLTQEETTLSQGISSCTHCRKTSSNSSYLREPCWLNSSPPCIWFKFLLPFKAWTLLIHFTFIFSCYLFRQGQAYTNLCLKHLWAQSFKIFNRNFGHTLIENKLCMFLYFYVHSHYIRHWILYRSRYYKINAFNLFKKKLLWKHWKHFRRMKLHFFLHILRLFQCEMSFEWL